MDELSGRGELLRTSTVPKTTTDYQYYHADGATHLISKSTHANCYWSLPKTWRWSSFRPYAVTFSPFSSKPFE